MNVHTSKTLLRNYVSTLNEVKKKDKNQKVNLILNYTAWIF